MKRFVAIIGTLMALGCGKDATAPLPDATYCLSSVRYEVHATTDTIRTLISTPTGGPLCAVFTGGESVQFNAATDVYLTVVRVSDGATQEAVVWYGSYAISAQVFERDGLLYFSNWTNEPYWLAWPGVEVRRTAQRLTTTFDQTNQYGRVILESVWVPR